MNAAACSQTGCSDLASAPELFPYGAPAAATSPCRAFVNKPLPLSHSLSVISFLQNLTHATAKCFSLSSGDRARDSLHSIDISLKPGFVLDEFKISPGEFVKERIEMIDGPVLG